MAATRLEGVTYAGLVLGRSQTNDDYLLTNNLTFSHGKDSASVSFQVVVANATRATFLASEAALLAAYRKHDQDLTVVLGTTNRHAYSHASNTGFNAVADITRLRGTGNSATYQCSVIVRLPADLAGRSGRQSATVDVAYAGSGRRVVTISGVYTALTTNSARDQYEAQIGTYTAAVLTSLGGTYNTMSRPAAISDDQDKVLNFSHAYEEIIFGEGVGTTDVAGVVNQRLVIQRDLVGIGDTTDLGDVRPLVTVAVDYSAEIDSAVTTNLESFYTSTIRPHLVNQAQQHSGAGGLAVITLERPIFDLPNNQIAALMLLSVNAGGTFLRARVDTSNSVDAGLIFRNVWDANPFARDVYQGPMSHVRTVSVFYTYAGDDDPLISMNAQERFGGENMWLVREREGATTNTRIGLPNGSTILTNTRRRTFVFVRADAENEKAPEPFERLFGPDAEDQGLTLGIL